MASGVVHFPSESYNNNFIDVPTYSYNMTGSITNVFGYRIYKDIFEFGGCCRINVTARTGSNPGVYFNLPSSRKLLTSLYIQCGSVGDANNHMFYEMLRIQTAQDNTQISVTTTESHSNMPTGSIRFSIPIIRCALQPL